MNKLRRSGIIALSILGAACAVASQPLFADETPPAVNRCYFTLEYPDSSLLEKPIYVLINEELYRANPNPNSRESWVLNLSPPIPYDSLRVAADMHGIYEYAQPPHGRVVREDSLWACEFFFPRQWTLGVRSDPRGISVVGVISSDGRGRYTLDSLTDFAASISSGASECSLAVAVCAKRRLVLATNLKALSSAEGRKLQMNRAAIREQLFHREEGYISFIARLLLRKRGEDVLTNSLILEIKEP